MQIEDLYKKFLKSTGISTDTRKVKEGNLFFALKGENYDANDFASIALEKGASFAVVDRAPNKDDRIIEFQDSLKTLQELARYHRLQLGIPVVALTGSNGKTTTKELINAVLSRKYRTTATAGNLNNHIGVPLTLLSMTAQTEVGIIEMGANHQKEIDFLCRIAEPDFGYITNFGKAHLEGFGSVEGIIKGKKELYGYLKEHSKMLFLNLDDPLQKTEDEYPKKFSFGADNEADIKVEYPENGTFATIKVGQASIESNIIGAYNARNMAAAYCIGKYFEVPEEEIKKALKAYTPANNRSQLIQKNNVQIVLDAYNANPTSMAAALENLDQMKGTRNAILGDMFELGNSAAEEHQHLVNVLQKRQLNKIFLIGENFFRTSSSDSIKKFRSFDDFKADFEPSDIEDSVVLIKGSRGMALERVLDLLH